MKCTTSWLRVRLALRATIRSHRRAPAVRRRPGDPGLGSAGARSAGTGRACGPGARPRCRRLRWWCRSQPGGGAAREPRAVPGRRSGRQADVEPGLETCFAWRSRPASCCARASTSAASTATQTAHLPDRPAGERQLCAGLAVRAAGPARDSLSPRSTTSPSSATTSVRHGVEARLRLTLYLLDAPGAPRSKRVISRWAPRWWWPPGWWPSATAVRRGGGRGGRASTVGARRARRRQVPAAVEAGAADRTPGAAQDADRRRQGQFQCGRSRCSAARTGPRRRPRRPDRRHPAAKLRRPCLLA